MTEQDHKTSVCRHQTSITSFLIIALVVVHLHNGVRAVPVSNGTAVK